INSIKFRNLYGNPFGIFSAYPFQRIYLSGELMKALTLFQLGMWTVICGTPLAMADGPNEQFYIGDPGKPSTAKESGALAAHAVVAGGLEIYGIKGWRANSNSYDAYDDVRKARNAMNGIDRMNTIPEKDELVAKSRLALKGAQLRLEAAGGASSMSDMTAAIEAADEQLARIKEHEKVVDFTKKYMAD